MAVTGTKPTRLVVVPYRPYFRLLVSAGVAVLFVVAVGGSYWLGKHHGVTAQADAMGERDRLRRELQAKTDEADSLSQQVANLRLASEVDKASSEDVRNQVIELKAQIASLEKDITFYRGLMAPSENRSGLTIGSVDVISTGVPRRYDFKVVMQQLATNHQVLNGSVNITVVGHEDGATRNMPLKDLSPQIDEEDIKLRFKYFQNIEGYLDLPPGFEPERIELVAKSTGRNAKSVEKKFGWLVHES
ncbi:DUF6776 family protein [Gilvimarinus sp. F26214L]|uniref:DUF6776 family protein n=1 Tax=Gilvimarinus sp. DZF01 TaxID=3461371 RepID=UPI00404674CD